jgi:hypothetical protein
MRVAFLLYHLFSIEYDPEPPVDAGSPEKAPKPVVELVRTAAAAQI